MKNCTMCLLAANPLNHCENGLEHLYYSPFTSHNGGSPADPESNWYSHLDPSQGLQHTNAVTQATSIGVSYNQVSNTLPCRFCGWASCSMTLQQKPTTFTVITTCPNSWDFSLKSSKRSLKQNPSTNCPIIYCICTYNEKTKEFPTIWKYNIQAHFTRLHTLWQLTARGFSTSYPAIKRGATGSPHTWQPLWLFLMLSAH